MLTVTLATRNRSEILARTLNAFANIEPPHGGWRLVVVDNGSTDDTAETVKRARSDLPLIYLYEPNAGKNHALNRALGSIEGDIAVFTDDDVLPQEDWLVRIREAADTHPECSIFGGTIRPEWPGAKPACIDNWKVPIGLLFALIERPTGPCSFQYVWGPNMAVRTNVFVEHAFDPSYGPDGTLSYKMGSEGEFLKRLELAGHKAWFEKDAVVSHIIRPEQLDETWMLGRAWRHGYRQTDRAWHGLRICKVSPPLLFKLALVSAASLVARVLPPSRVRFKFLFLHNQLMGRARAARERSV